MKIRGDVWTGICKKPVRKVKSVVGRGLSPGIKGKKNRSTNEKGRPGGRKTRRLGKPGLAISHKGEGTPSFKAKVKPANGKRVTAVGEKGHK